MTADLHLNIHNRYNIVALMFFIPYIIFEFPATVFVRTLGVRTFLGSIALLWGVVMLSCGFVTAWEQLVGLRVLLGLFEAGFFPACIYLVSTWYIRCKFQYRLVASNMLIHKLRRDAAKICPLLSRGMLCFSTGRSMYIAKALI